jgi:hypothetical protein
MRRADICTKQKPLGLGELTLAAAKFYDEYEECDGADERNCYCHVRQ